MRWTQWKGGGPKKVVVLVFYLSMVTSYNNVIRYDGDVNIGELLVHFSDHDYVDVLIIEAIDNVQLRLQDHNDLSNCSFLHLSLSWMAVTSMVM